MTLLLQQYNNLMQYLNKGYGRRQQQDPPNKNDMEITFVYSSCYIDDMLNSRLPTNTTENS